MIEEGDHRRDGNGNANLDNWIPGGGARRVSFQAAGRGYHDARRCSPAGRAQSRKKGFSKTALCNALSDAGIAYKHLRYLGMSDDLMPKRNADDNSEILTEFRRRLEAEPEVPDELRGLVGEHRVCLLCFEADQQQCHRTVIAELLNTDTVYL